MYVYMYIYCHEYLLIYIYVPICYGHLQRQMNSHPQVLSWMSRLMTHTHTKRV